MTHWRDARLEQALAHAPDDGLRPADTVRAAVLASARQAVAGQAAAVAAPLPLWRRAWEAMGRPGQPWNAAFATVLLACLVTVLWWDKPVPDAAADKAAADRAAPAAPEPAATPSTTPSAARPAPPPAPPAPPAAAAVPAPAQAPADLARTAPDLEKKAVAKPQAAAPSPLDSAPAPAAAPVPPPAPAPVAPAAQGGAPALAAAETPAPLAQAAPAEPKAESRKDAATADTARSRAAPAAAAPAAPPAYAPAPAPAPAPAMPAPFARELAESSNRSSAAAAGGLSAALPASQAPGAAGRLQEPLSLTLEGRALSFTPGQAGQIEPLARALAAQAAGGEPLQSRVVAVIELRRDRAGAGTLQLAPPQIRWMPMRPGAQPLTGRPDAAQLQALLEALQQLPAR